MVALIPASLLISGVTVLENVPDITDVDRLIKILEKLGSKINFDKEQKVLTLDNSNVTLENINKDDLGSMRGTSLLWGPLLARVGKVLFKDLPGGCTLGPRPLDVHYEAFKNLGVKVEEADCGVVMTASDAKAGNVWLTEMSPTATENALMLATKLNGLTRIFGAASEPNVQDLCHFLNNCGAKIEGIGSNVLTIHGGQDLKPTKHKIISDHYEIATFLAMSAVTGGSLKVFDAIPEHFEVIKREFEAFNVKIKYEGTTAIVDAGTEVKLTRTKPGKTQIVRAQPWPALPVDLLPIFIPLALKATAGTTLFHNWMYEAGLFWTSELTKLGANITMCDPHRVLIVSGNKLGGATLEAPYIIRAVVAMTIAAMIADGESTILNADALYRGHPNFVENLTKLGAGIEQIK